MTKDELLKLGLAAKLVDEARVKSETKENVSFDYELDRLFDDVVDTLYEQVQEVAYKVVRSKERPSH